jgi:hypothetical protein
MSAQVHFVSADDATYADLKAAPAGYTVDLIGGRLHALPRPKGKHVHSASVLGRRLGGPFEDGSGGPGAPIQAPPFEAVAFTLFGGAPPWAPPLRGQPGGGPTPLPADL